jgi:hypothetical protein
MGICAHYACITNTICSKHAHMYTLCAQQIMRKWHFVLTQSSEKAFSENNNNEKHDTPCIQTYLLRARARTSMRTSAGARDRACVSVRLQIGVHHTCTDQRIHNHYCALWYTCLRMCIRTCTKVCEDHDHVMHFSTLKCV